MRAYISGPMTGVDGYNYAAFAKLCRELRVSGYDVFDPTELFGGRTDYPWEHYMRACLLGLFTCDRVFALPGWRTSVGATIEVAAALSSAISVWEIDLQLNEWVAVEAGRENVAHLIGMR
jgi:hypothetical protein